MLKKKKLKKKKEDKNQKELSDLEQPLTTIHFYRASCWGSVQFPGSLFGQAFPKLPCITPSDSLGTWNTPWLLLLLMLLVGGILRHPGCKRPCKWWDKPSINWCSISESSTSFLWPYAHVFFTILSGAWTRDGSSQYRPWWVPTPHSWWDGPICTNQNVGKDALWWFRIRKIPTPK